MELDIRTEINELNSKTKNYLGKNFLSKPLNKEEQSDFSISLPNYLDNPARDKEYYDFRYENIICTKIY